MKPLSLFLILIYTSFLSAQNLNQLDANGKRHGVWHKKFDHTNLTRYTGRFNHGKEVGTFKFYKKANSKAVLAATKTFNATNNKAYVKFYNTLGKVISEGQMDGKKYIGTWKFYQKKTNNLLIREHYNNNGNLQGERYVYYKNGQAAEKQFYKDGKLHGESFWYTESGTVLKHFIYQNGELHGVSKYYSALGKLVTVGAYKKGKKHGIWKYYKNDKLIEEKDFSYKRKVKANTK